MKRAMLAVGAVTLLRAAGPANEDTAKKELQRLQGPWVTLRLIEHCKE